MTRNSLGDPTGIEDMERALELALRIDSPVAGPIVNNLAVEAFLQGDLERTESLYAESVRVSLRLGDRESARFTGANQIWMDFFRGRWDVALRRADAFIAECEAGAPHGNEFAMRIIRGSLRRARGDADDALDDHLRALELARASGDPGDVISALAACAATRESRGELAEARGLADEVVRTVNETGITRAFDLAAVAERLGVREPLLAALDANPLSRAVVWRDALRLALQGDLVAAADIGSRTGNVAWEARLRFEAGERLLELGSREEGETQLRKALDFYRSVGAAYLVERGEAILGEAQRDSA
jgi:tetratricopeptide (TPR) repeat protein